MSFSATLGRGLYPVGKWGFEDNVKDSSGAGNHGTIHGNPQYVDGMVGKALDFDGNDYISFGNDASLRITDTITLEAWVKPATISGSHWIIQRGHDYTVICQSNNDIRWTIILTGVNSSITANNFLSVGHWTHIVGTYNKDGGTNNHKLYVDGVLIDQGTGIGILQRETSNWFIGVMTWPGNSRFFNGIIDEPRIYNEAISSSQIRENYYAGLERLLAKGEINGEEYKEMVAELSNLSS